MKILNIGWMLLLLDCIDFFKKKSYLNFKGGFREFEIIFKNFNVDWMGILLIINFF